MPSSTPVPDATASTDASGSLLGRLAPFALCLALAVMQFVDLRDGLSGHPQVVSLFLVGFSALTLVTLVPLLRWRALPRTGRLALGASTALFGWALVSSLVTPLPRLTRPTTSVPRTYLVVPVVTALVTLLGSWGLVAVVPALRRRRMLWWASMVVLATTVLGGIRTGIARHSLRLGTGMGGAATFHVVLLLVLGVLLSAAMRGERRAWSLAGALVSALGILATGSRAGLIGLALFVAGMAVALASRGRGRLVAGVVGALVVVLGVAMAAVPTLRRLLKVGDVERQANYATALHAVTANPLRVLVGVGEGRMWPWYAFETGRLKVPWKGVILSDTFGRNLTNPHSVPIGVLAELGLVGVALLAVLVGVLVVVLVRSWRVAAAVPGDAPRAHVESGLATMVLPLAVVCSLAAFCFDYYLFKNYAVTFWWWVVVATLLSEAPAAVEEDAR